jgi:TRAP transporter 4TM/12TM fusion protein
MRAKAIAQLNMIFLILGSLFSLYLLSTVVRLFQDPSEHYTTFYLGIMVLTGIMTIRNILAKPINGFKLWFNLIFFGTISAIAVFVGFYLRYNAILLTQTQPFFETPAIMIGWLMIISLLILNWYHWGTILNVMIALAIAYVFWGHKLALPLLAHDEFTTAFAMSYMGLDTIAGIFWFVPLAADNIYFLIIFAALLIGIGMLPLVMELGKWVGRYVKGGAAFPAIVGSALTGTVMGQAVSNTMLTGQLTIPMMKKHGYEPDFAGAIEAVASTSGQLLPPILGLAAFIIAGFLNIAYIEVALAATLPALLFVGGIVIAVLLAAQSKGLKYLTEKVDLEIIKRLLPAFAGSFLTVLVLLLLYYSPSVAALTGIAVLLILSAFQGQKRPGIKTLISGFNSGLEVVVPLSLLLLAIGPIAQMATVTSLASKLSAVLTNVLPPNLMFILAGTMIVSIFMGTGLPTPVAYLVVALTLTPFLQDLGVEALYAHMFCFYFAVFSTISPPVAISCLAAAKLSQGSVLGTARESLRIALPTFFVPYIFIFNKELLEFPHMTWAGAWVFLATLMAMFMFSVGLFGFLKRKLSWLERIAAVVSAILGIWYLFSHSLTLLAAFLSCSIVLILWAVITGKRLTVGETLAET